MSEENLPDSEAKKSKVVDSWMAHGRRNEERQDIALDLHRRDVEQRERGTNEQARHNEQYDRRLQEFETGSNARHKENVALSLEERNVQERIAAALEKIAERL